MTLSGKKSSIELYDWQVEPVRTLTRLFDRGRRAGEQQVLFDLSDMGIGKTVVALQTVANLGRPAMVVGPKSAIPVWADLSEQMAFAPGDVLTTNYEYIVRCPRHMSRTYGRWDPEQRSKIWQWRLSEDTLFIWDEAHRLTGLETYSSRIFLSAWRQGYDCLLLSATLLDHPLKHWAIGQVLGLHDGGYSQWPRYLYQSGLVRVQMTRPTRRGPVEYSKWVPGTSVADKQRFVESRQRIAQLIANRKVRITIRELGDRFPRNHVATQLLTPSITKLQALDVYVRKCQREKTTPNFTKLRQLLEEARAPDMAELALETLSEGRVPVCFVNFRTTLASMVKSLAQKCRVGSRRPYKVSTLHGDHSENERREAIDDFQTGRTQIFLATVQAGGESISLHDTTGDRPRVAWISLPSSALLLRQALGRVHRAGGRSPSLQRILFSDHWTERRLYKQVRDKIGTIRAINDNDLSHKLAWEEHHSEEDFINS